MSVVLSFSEKKTDNKILLVQYTRNSIDDSVKRSISDDITLNFFPDFTFGEMYLGETPPFLIILFYDIK